MLPVMEIEPATVPVMTRSADGNTAVVLFGGTVKSTLLPPVEN